jgi:hypothetical protein
VRDIRVVGRKGEELEGGGQTADNKRGNSGIEVMEGGTSEDGVAAKTGGAALRYEEVGSKTGTGSVAGPVA